MNEIIGEGLTNACEELKRVDHLIYVSLKYTRTCDVLKNVINRLIACLDCIFDAFLKKAEQEGRVFEIPYAPLMKAAEFKKLFPNDPKIEAFTTFYLLLRKINRAEYTKSNEFRRYVTMHLTIEKEEVNVDIDLVTQYYKDLKGYIEYVKELGKKE